MEQMYYHLPCCESKKTVRNLIGLSVKKKRPRSLLLTVQNIAVFLLCMLIVFLFSCSRGSRTIAVIPRSCGTVLSEPEHAGAAHFARKHRIKLYWNAPPREDDVEGQIAVLNRVVERGLSGVIITPDQTLPLRTPVTKLVSRGLPVVVVGTHLGIAPSAKLSYVLNDEKAGGQMAAKRLGAILNGTGAVAILGVNPQLTGITVRQREFENTLAKEFPKVHVIGRTLGHSSVAQEQQVAEDLLNRGMPLDAIVALSASSTRGAFYALVEFGKAHQIKLIGFDQDLIPPIRTGGIDSVVMQRTYDMGNAAMSLMLSELNGQAVPGVTTLTPILITRENLDSPEVYHQLTADWWAAK